MLEWRLWTRGDWFTSIDGIAPRPTKRGEAPEQRRLMTYLDHLAAALGEAADGEGRQFLHMDVDVGAPERLLSYGDLDNLLAPVVGRIGPRHFNFVSANKRVGGGSRIVIGASARRGRLDGGDSWSHLSCCAGTGTRNRRWKQGLQRALAAATPLPPGPVALHLAWRCSPRRNWATLWKPTCDALAPLLGLTQSWHPYHPRDDRVVSLALHLNHDEALGHNVEIGMWWRSAVPPPLSAPERRAMLERLFGRR